MNFLQETMAQIDGHIAMEVERETQKQIGEVSQTVNNFILQCQQGGQMVQNVAQVQRGLLEVEIQRQVEEKIKTLETGMAEFLRLHVEDLKGREGGLVQKLEFLNNSISELKTFLNMSKETKKTG